jgi:hypothetical protein
MDDLEARALEEDILDKRDLTLALVQIVQTEELKRDAMKLRDTAADNFMNRLLAVSCASFMIPLSYTRCFVSHSTTRQHLQINWSICQILT